MARTADHEARRAQIMTAVQQIAVDEGLERASLSRTADRAGVSVGMVQHYFDSKSDLLVATHRWCLAQRLARIEASTIAAEMRYERIEQILGSALSQLLPLNQTSHRESSVATQFSMLAAHHQELRAEWGRSQRDLRGRVAVAIRNGKECGEVDSRVDVPSAAYAVLTLTLGAAQQLLVTPTAAEQRRAKGAIAAALAETFAGPCDRESRRR